MEGISRLKLKVGQHEFEAEGPPDFVQSQFDAWKAMTTTAAAVMVPQTQIFSVPDRTQGTMPATNQDLASSDARLDKIMTVTNRIVSLTARPKTVGEAVLLLLYGQKMMRENDSVTGGEVMDGLVATGGYMLPRVDRLLEQLGGTGDVIVIGERRSKRYRLTNAGLGRARQIATDLLALVA